MRAWFGREHRAGWVLFLLSFFLNVWLIAADLPYVSHPDEPRVIRHAIAVAAGDLNPHFFVYPSLWIYLVALAQGMAAVGGLALGQFKGREDLASAVFTRPDVYFLAGRFFAAALGAGAVWLSWRLGSRFSQKAGWVSGISLALFAPFVWQAHFATTDVPLVFFFLLCLDGAVSRLSGDAAAPGWYIWPAAAAGLAASIKYNGGVALGAVLALVAIRTQAEGKGVTLLGRRMLAGAICALMAFLLTSPFALLDLSTFRSDFLTILHGLGTGERVPAGPWGYAQFLIENQGILFFAAALIGWVLILTSRGRRQERRCGFVLLCAFLPYLMLVEIPLYKSPRTILPFVPALGLGAGVALDRLVEFLPRLGTPRRVTPGLWVLIGALLLLPSLRSTAGVERGFAREPASTAALRWFKTHVEPGRTVFVDARTWVSLPPDRETVRDRIRLWDADSSSISGMLARAYGHYLETEQARQGYRLVPSFSIQLNTFASGPDSVKDFSPDRLQGVEYVVSPGDAFRFGKHPSRDPFYLEVQRSFELVHAATDAEGRRVDILRRK